MKPAVTFWSSVESAMLADGPARELRAAGFEVDHRFAVSSDEYRAPRGGLHRLALRFRTYVLFPLRLTVCCVTERRPKINVVTTNPFFAPWLAVRMSPSSVLVVHLVFDLFPTALVVAGRLNQESWIARVIRRVVREVFSRADLNIFLGNHLRAAAEAEFGPIANARIIPVGAKAPKAGATEPSELGQSEVPRILYCGNFGAMHDVHTLAGVLRLFEGRATLPSVRLDFHASGGAYREFCDLARRVSPRIADWVRLDAPLDDANWAAQMSRAHIALVTMLPGSERVVMPSKTYSALVAGQAILAICPEHSDLAELVRQCDCGWVVPPSGVKELAEVIDLIAADHSEVQRKRTNAFHAGRGDLSESAIGKMWVQNLASIG